MTGSMGPVPVTLPNCIFSEANYDLMVLLLYLSIIKESVKYGQAKVLILDDVLQSVDNTIRARFVDYLLNNFHDWQLIVTCHDDLWYQQLMYLFNTHGHHFKSISIDNWSFDNGPLITSSDKIVLDSDLLAAIGTKNKHIIAAQSGRFLEMICQNISKSMSISVHRTIDDKYTLGDLWPGIRKQLKASQLKELLVSIDRDMLTRNMLGCHANDWAESMSDGEVLTFANNVDILFHSVYCEECHEWITNKSCLKNPDLIAECNCRRIQIGKGY